MSQYSNSPTLADCPEMAYLVAGRAVAAIVLGLKLNCLGLVQTPQGEYEARMKFALDDRPASLEEIVVIEICGRWAEATVMLRHQVTRKRPPTAYGTPPSSLDKKFVLDNAEFIAANYYEAIEELASRLMNGTMMDANAVAEAIHDGLMLSDRVH